jgi:hypothetical protein
MRANALVEDDALSPQSLPARLGDQTSKGGSLSSQDGRDRMRRLWLTGGHSHRSCTPMSRANIQVPVYGPTNGTLARLIDPDASRLSDRHVS